MAKIEDILQCDKYKQSDPDFWCDCDLCWKERRAIRDFEALLKIKP